MELHKFMEKFIPKEIACGKNPCPYDICEHCKFSLALRIYTDKFGEKQRENCTFTYQDCHNEGNRPLQIMDKIMLTEQPKIKDL